MRCVGALSPYRVLDLTSGRVQLAGMMLAGLGADVVLVEPPGGSAGPSGRAVRRRPGRPGPLADVLGGEPGQAQRRAGPRPPRPGAGSCWTWSPAPTCSSNRGAPGELAALGLGYDDLAARNPALVVVSVTPFGQDGPKAHWAATT